MMKLLFSPSITYFYVLADVFTNISAGYIGLTLIAPTPSVAPFTMVKHLILALIFYLLAVKLKEWG